MHLIHPCADYRDEFCQALWEIHHSGMGLRESLQWDAAALAADFAVWVEQIRRLETADGLAPSAVPCTEFWLVDGHRYYGRIKIRHHLNPALRQFGGHIGYEIRPSEQGQGRGKTLLALGLQQAASLGLAQVLISCDEDNHASRAIIEANGGLCEGRFELAGHPKPILRYWLATAGPTDSVATHT